MLDTKLIVKDPEYANYVKERLATRSFSLDLDKIKNLEIRRKELIALIEEGNRKKKILSKKFYNLSKEKERNYEILLMLLIDLVEGRISEDEYCECLGITVETLEEILLEIQGVSDA